VSSQESDGGGVASVCRHGDVLGVQTAVRTAEGDSKAFDVKVGLHQGSILSSLLFVTVMEVIAKELRVGQPLPLELLYAYDLILMVESEAELHNHYIMENWDMKLKV